jgi:signal transduction histidine kinase
VPGGPPAATGARSPESLARLVHDLHAPLTVIRGLCATLVRDEPREDRRRGLAMIDGEALRLAAGLEGIARSAAPSDWTRWPVALAPLAATVAERHRALAAERGASVAARRHRGDPVVDAGPDALRRALDNLVQNAIRHCAREVRLAVGARGGAAHVVVRDDGPGVPAADRERIFWPRERGSTPVGPGRGLGLAIAREIAHAHGGDLTLDPTGPGAAFRLSLPLVGGAGTAPLAA